LVIFKRPVEIPGLGTQKRLVAGTEQYVNGTILSSKLVKVPAMYRDPDTQELVIGGRRYPLSGGDVESYELAKMASGVGSPD
jgi:hypothetical protein